ncbi:MAG: ribosome maturation factor RimM [Dehalococcoidia bacterium]
MAQDGTSQPEPITVGTILGIHGVSGQVRARVQSDVPGRFDPGQVLYIHGTPYHIQLSDLLPRNQVLLKFLEVNSPIEARRLTGELLTTLEPVPTQLPEGEYFHYQLLGLQVVTEGGEELGAIIEILETGSNDVYVVSGPQGELLIPALTQVVKQVSLDTGKMVVRLMDGLR